MLDFSFAAGLEPMWSSFSRIVFSDATILRVAMMVCSLSAHRYVKAAGSRSPICTETEFISAKQSKNQLRSYQACMVRGGREA